jgi:glutathione S-transferase
MELDLELPARRLYRAAFFGGMLSDETKQLVQKELEKGVRAFMKLAKFSPWVAGAEFTAADCAAAVHLPLISLASKTTYGADAFGEHADAGRPTSNGQRAPIGKPATTAVSRRPREETPMQLHPVSGARAFWVSACPIRCAIRSPSRCHSSIR